MRANRPHSRTRSRSYAARFIADDTYGSSPAANFRGGLERLVPIPAANPTAPLRQVVGSHRPSAVSHWRRVCSGRRHSSRNCIGEVAPLSAAGGKPAHRARWRYRRGYRGGYRIALLYPRGIAKFICLFNAFANQARAVINPDFALRAAAAWTALRAQCCSLFLLKFEIHLLPRPLSDFVRSVCLEGRGAGTISSYKEDG
jgi:hypothetical protein